jgi:hypothetical protein
VNKSVFLSLLQSTLSDCKRLVLLQTLEKRFSNLKMLLVNNDNVSTVSLPLLFILIFARTLQNSTRDTICTADDHVKIACKEGASDRRAKIFIRKYWRKLWLWLWYLKVFKNSVLVFICKLANQRKQRLPIHRFYCHTGSKSRKEYCCDPLDEPPCLSSCSTE